MAANVVFKIPFPASGKQVDFSMFTPYIPDWTEPVHLNPIKKTPNGRPNERCGWRVHFKDTFCRENSTCVVNALRSYLEINKPKNTMFLGRLEYHAGSVWSIDYFLPCCLCGPLLERPEPNPVGEFTELLNLAMHSISPYKYMDM